MALKNAKIFEDKARDTQTNQTVLDAVDLGVSYGEHEAIAKLNFKVRKGEFVAVLGPSGCGKSSLLDVLSGLRAPSRGVVRIAGNELFTPTSIMPRVGYVFQSHRLLPWKTVQQNLEIAMSAASIEKAEWQDRIDNILAILQISDYKCSWPMRLSGGQRQRVSIARALLIDPAYILMDEPLSTLDEVTARSLRQELTTICQRTNATVVFVTHSIREAVFLADRVLILTRGPAEIFEDHRIEIERPRAYEDERIGSTERSIVAKVQTPWGLGNDR